MTDRPSWGFTLTELQVRKLNSSITKVTSHRTQTGVDTSRDWFEFHCDDGPFIVPDRWDDLFEFKPYWAGLILPTWKGKEAIKRLKEIDAWEKENAADRAEYERLSAKFETKGT